jgi:hypothetical protein
MKLATSPKKKILLFTLFLISVSALFLAIVNYCIFHDFKTMEKEQVLSIANEKINFLFFEINTLPGGISEDILFIKDLSSLQQFISENNSICFTKDLSVFLEQNPLYNEFCVLDIQGKNLFSLSSNKNKSSCDSLLFLSDFNAIKNLEDNAIYLSRLIKNNDQSVLIYASPVYFKNQKAGFLVAQINAEYFLEDIRSVMMEKESF